MMVSIIQISDVHIENGDNPALFRVDEIVSALRGLNADLAGVVIAVPGDIAFSGTSEQYSLAEAFFRELMARIEQDLPGTSPQIVFSPGNHDCDLSLATDIRKRSLIDTLLPTLDIAGAMATHWLDVQEPYFLFAERFGQTSHSNLDKIVLRREFVIARSIRVAFACYNTAWLTQNPEIPGQLYIPTSCLAHFEDAPADIEISLFHHPYNWLEPTNAIAFKHFIESRSDLVLTGHEHTADAYTKVRSDRGAVHFVEGRAMWDRRAQDNGFNIVLIDIEARRWQLHSFTWNKNRFTARTTTDSAPFLRNKMLAEQGFEINHTFQRELTDPGTGFTHPKKVELRLQDLFVYPTLLQRDLQRKVEGKKATATKIEGKDLLEYVLSEDHLFIRGSDLSGKTALSKTLYRDLQQESQMVPVLLNGRDLLSSDSISTAIDLAFSRQYSPSALEQYHQLERKRKVIIVDDLQCAKMKRATGMIEDGERLVGKVILIADDRFEIHAIASKGGESFFLRYRQYDIQEVGRPSRARLIEKWLALGRSEFDNEELYREVSAREKIIDTVLGRQLLPAYPIIILGVLQTLEATRNMNSSSGSYGELYEAFITDRLATISKKASDLGTKYTLLSRIAYWLYDKDVDSFTREDMTRICEDYFGEYRIRIEPHQLIDDLLLAQILRETDGNFRFKYRYYYHFFVGRYLKDNMSDANVRPIIVERLKYMADTVYYEDYTNILVFYLYFTKDLNLIDHLLRNAENIYAALDPADLETDVSGINALYNSTPKPIALPSADVEENRDRLRQQLDDAEASAHISEGERVSYDNALNDFIKMNIALKNLFILGQVLRNFPGSLKREVKGRIAWHCYLLGLRVLKVALEAITVNTDAFRIYFAQMLRQGRPTLTSRELAQSAEEAIITLAEFWTVGIVRTISQAVGMEDLAETYREVIEAHGGSLSVALVDLAIKLDHYGSFPENQVDNTERRVTKNTFGYCVLRHMVAHYFYIYRSEPEIRQKYCDRFEIRTQQTLLLGSGLRKS